ncbi:MAG: tetratricopeptide repeat protein [Acidobacteriota bacterium]
MKARPAARILAMMAAGVALSGALLSPRPAALFAQEPQPEAAPTPAPAPPEPPPSPGPKPAPAPGITSINQAFPLDYKSIVERLASAPDNPALLNELGNILVQHGRLEQAIVQYEKALKLQPDLAVTWNNMGVAQTAHGRMAEGERAYRKAIGLNPAYALAYYNLGANFDQRGKYDQALVYYQRAIESDPGLLDVRNNPQVATNRHLPEILIKSYLDKGGSVVLPVQSMYPPKPKKKPKP